MESHGFLEREELDIQIKELQAKAEAFFAVAGKEDIEVYRIEKFEPVRQDPEFLGKFYDGDSYVILKRTEKDYDIHYWHGKHASGDEQATAAAFTVQLSENLQLPSRHHLELMMEESPLFLSYFKSGIFYLEGGVESGFKHVEPKTYEKKLYIVKGKRYPRVWTLGASASNLNEGDVFILDLGMKLFVWPGRECNVNEKMKGIEISFNIKKERGAHPVVFYPRDDSSCEDEFWAELGGKPDQINPAIPDEGVEGGSAGGEQSYSFFKISNESGKLELTEITERPLRKDHLDTNDTFLLELPDTIYVWIGRKSNLEEKKNGMLTAKNFIEQKGKPKNTRISRIPEHAEDTHFKSFFNGFYPCLKQDFGVAKGFDATTANLDIEKMANQQKQAAKQLFDMLQDYQMQVYVVENDKPVALSESEWGHFFADDIYIIDLKGKGHRYVLMWMGPKLEAEQHTATSTYMDIVTNYENSNLITRTRVRRGHEEESLLSLFPNGFITHTGKRVPIQEKFAKIRNNGTMLRVQAPYGDAARAIEQIENKCANLNSGDAYIIIAAGGQQAYLWLGEGANDHEKSLGQKILDSYFSDIGEQKVYQEGQEADDFWTAVGGQTEYSRSKDTGMAAGFEPRLFHCSNAHGYFYVQEIYNFSQDDMLNDDIMLLDAYNTIYVWIGNKSNEFEKRGAFKSAQKYIESVRDERDKDQVQIVEIQAGKEAPSFTVLFPEWRQDKAQKWLDADPVKQMQGKLLKGLTVKVEEQKVEASKFNDPKTHKIPYEQLKGII
eukprot:403333332